MVSTGSGARANCPEGETIEVSYLGTDSVRNHFSGGSTNDLGFRCIKQRPVAFKTKNFDRWKGQGQSGMVEDVRYMHRLVLTLHGDFDAEGALLPNDRGAFGAFDEDWLL